MTIPINLTKWVEDEKDPVRRMVRQGMHTVMLATVEVGHHFPSMVMKGGVLLAIRYDSTRYTTDLDYSTTAQLIDIDTQLFLACLNEKLQHVSAALTYDMVCRVQSHKISPPRSDASYPTLQARIGLAPLTDAAQVRRLRANRAVHTVAVDYSFNEWAAETESLSGDLEEKLLVYDLTDLIAEKYRSLLQQTVRNRARYQDVYDLYYLLSVCGELDDQVRQAILEKLIRSSKGKLPALSGQELQSPELIMKTRERYDELATQVMNPPEFEIAYNVAQDLYERLPWR